MGAGDVSPSRTKVLSEAQCGSYHRDGFLLLESLLDHDTVSELVEVTEDFVARSRNHTKSNSTFDLAPEHSSHTPQVRRIKRPDEQHEAYWRAATGVIADVVADLLGPDVVYHHSKLNFKWHGGDDTVAWHQDIQFYPHTNYSPLTVGIYLRDTALEDGPLTVISVATKASSTINTMPTEPGPVVSHHPMPVRLIQKRRFASQGPPVP